MIPKVIHYCWFGKNKKSKLVNKCIKSWQKFCPDYKIVEWNEDNFNINISEYTKEAYNAGKWAFVSDYCRFYVLNTYGGIYMDTDVELIKSIDVFLESNFVGFECDDSVATGLIMGSESHNIMCEKLLEDYNNDRFLINGNMNLRTVCNRVTDLLAENGLILNNSTQKVLGYTVYDSSYFNPVNLNTGRIELLPNTVSIHHYSGSWLDKKSKFRGKIYRFIYRIFGKKIAARMKDKFGRKGAASSGIAEEKE